MRSCGACKSLNCPVCCARRLHTAWLACLCCHGRRAIKMTMRPPSCRFWCAWLTDSLQAGNKQLVAHNLQTTRRDCQSLLWMCSAPAWRLIMNYCDAAGSFVFDRPDVVRWFRCAPSPSLVQANTADHQLYCCRRLLCHALSCGPMLTCNSLLRRASLTIQHLEGAFWP